MNYFKIGNTDFSHLVSSLKTNYEVLLSSKSGRNAAGNNVVDIVNRKTKVEIGFRPMNEVEMASLLKAIEPFVINVSFLDSKTNQLQTIRCYTGTPSPEYYTIQDGFILYKGFNLSFIQM